MQKFEELNLPETLSNALEKIGFHEPTEIQAQAIPVLLAGKDLMACAETGSGKTGAYMIPMLKDLLEDPNSQGMVLAPTRELAQQISEFIKTLMPDERAFHTTRLVGGQDIRKQFKSLQRKPRVIVATPGRLIDHLKRNTVQIHQVNRLVLDEGDRMIDMGFAPQLQQILKFLPKERQTSFFSATMDDKVKSLAKKYLHKPAQLILNNSRPVAKIKQTIIQVDFKDKDACVIDELNARTGSIIVFVKTKHRTDLLKKHLTDYGFEVGLIHGGRTQGQRNQAIRSFKNGKIRILCATDVAARGIDVPHVEHVINFDLPMQDEDYVHRVGRTARNGAEGEAVSFVTPQEHRDWNRIAKKFEIPDLLPESPRKEKRGRKKFGKSSGKPSRKSSGKASSRDSDKKKPFRRKSKTSGGAKAGGRSKTGGRSKAGVKSGGGSMGRSKKKSFSRASAR